MFTLYYYQVDEIQLFEEQRENLLIFFSENQLKALECVIQNVSYKQLVENYIPLHFDKPSRFETNLEAFSKNYQKLLALKDIIEILNDIVLHANVFSSTGSIENEFMDNYRKTVTSRQVFRDSRKSDSSLTKVNNAITNAS